MTTQTMDISEARGAINSIDEKLRRARLIKVTRHKKDAFFFVDPDYLEALIETVNVLGDPEAMSMLARSIEDIKAGRLHDHEDVKKELL